MDLEQQLRAGRYAACGAFRPNVASATGYKPREQRASAAGHVSAERRGAVGHGTAIVADKRGLAYPDRVAITR